MVFESVLTAAELEFCKNKSVIHGQYIRLATSLLISTDQKW